MKFDKVNSGLTTLSSGGFGQKGFMSRGLMTEGLRPGGLGLGLTSGGLCPGGGISSRNLRDLDHLRQQF